MVTQFTLSCPFLEFALEGRKNFEKEIRTQIFDLFHVTEYFNNVIFLT